MSPAGGAHSNSARGYKLLAHAEIEAYLEDVARAVVTARISAWKKKKSPSNLLVAFLACFHSGWVDYDDAQQQLITELSKGRQNKKLNEHVSEIVDCAQKQFVHQLLNNHGIREKNLKTLVLPTGIDITDLDQTWIADLDDFGKQRGDIAHSAKGASATVNPEDEYKRVERLLIGLEELDKRLSKAK